MIRLRHIAHPIRALRSLFRRVYAGAAGRITKWQVDRQYRFVTYMEQQRCWCGGELQPCRLHAGFAVCADCGCYVNRRPPRPEALKQMYALQRYWRLRQRMRGHPPIERRAELYLSDGRVNYWISLVNRFAAGKRNVVEVGCSPGVVLSELKKQGYKCVGVEPDEETSEWIQNATGVEVRAGLFPAVPLSPCDLFLAFDVAEHVPDPLAFWNGISQILVPGGVAILETVIEGSDFERPFKGRMDFFDETEHFFLFTEASIRKLAASAKLQVVAFEDANAPVGYLGGICVLRKPLD